MSEHKNPFLEPYGTPHDTVPFNRIRLEDFEEAFIEGIRRDNEQIEKTINNPEKPTFDNTIINTEEDEDYYDLLSRVSSVFFNLLSAETNDDMDALAQKIQPMLTQHANDVRLNPKLFERIRYVHLHHRQLTKEEKQLLDNCYEGFVRSGALLDEAGKERLRQLTEEASMLSLQFSQNLLKEQKAFTLDITDDSQLDGLPDTAREAAALTAKEQGKQGWVFTLDYPSYLPFMTYSTQRELRKQLYMARNTICTHQNTENNLDICKRLINLRREMAQLLGYKTYADYVLKRRMASNKRHVYHLLDELIDAYKPTAIKEREELKKIFEKENKSLTSPPSPLTSDYNQAIMDFGAIQCTPQSPKCERCPLMESCEAFRNGCIQELPVKLKTLKIHERHLIYIYIRCKGQTAIHRRGPGDIWQGLYEPFILEARGEMLEVRKMLKASGIFSPLTSHLLPLKKNVKHVLTHRILYADFYLLETDQKPVLPSDYIWIPEADIDNYALPRLIEILLDSVPHPQSANK